MLAKGEAVEPSGNLSPGKNIYKLKYNCDLENFAQALANNCTDLYALQVGAGENVYTSNVTESNDAALQSATSAWWDELRSGGDFNKTDPLYYTTEFTFVFGIRQHKPHIGFFDQMASANTLTVGCGVGHCSANPTMVVCYYTTDVSFQRNIYQVGAPCSGCTTYAGSTCDSALGLCVAPDANYQNPF